MKLSKRAGIAAVKAWAIVMAIAVVALLLGVPLAVVVGIVIGAFLGPAVAVVTLSMHETRQNRRRQRSR